MNKRKRTLPCCSFVKAFVMWKTKDKTFYFDLNASVIQRSDTFCNGFMSDIFTFFKLNHILKLISSFKGTQGKIFIKYSMKSRENEKNWKSWDTYTHVWAQIPIWILAITLIFIWNSHFLFIRSCVMLCCWYISPAFHFLRMLLYSDFSFVLSVCGKQ